MPTRRLDLQPMPTPPRLRRPTQRPLRNVAYGAATGRTRPSVKRNRMTLCCLICSSCGHPTRRCATVSSSRTPLFSTTIHRARERPGPRRLYHCPITTCPHLLPPWRVGKLESRLGGVPCSAAELSFRSLQAVWPRLDWHPPNRHPKRSPYMQTWALI